MAIEILPSLRNDPEVAALMCAAERRLGALTNPSFGQGSVQQRRFGAVVAPAIVVVLGLAIALLGSALGDGSAKAEDVGRCTPIHWMFNAPDAPVGALGDVREAFVRLGRATGFRFVYDGTTRERPGESQVSYRIGSSGPVPAPILVTWVRAVPMSHWFDGEVAQAWGLWNGFGASRRLVSGVVYLRSDPDRPEGFGPGGTWGRVLLHELGHVVGLSHSMSPDDMMYPLIGPEPARWSERDLGRLASVGSDAGCRR